MSTVPTTLAYTVDEACSVAGIGRTALYKAIGTGELVARKYGRKTLILASDLHRFKPEAIVRELQDKGISRKMFFDRKNQIEHQTESAQRLDRVTAAAKRKRFNSSN